MLLPVLTSPSSPPPPPPPHLPPLSLSLSLCAQPLSRFCFFGTPQTVARQPPLSMGFPRQEYWSGLPFPTPGTLPNPEIKLTSHVSCLGKWILCHLESPLAAEDDLAMSPG